jgi:hypothetical protein
MWLRQRVRRLQAVDAAILTRLRERLNDELFEAGDRDKTDVYRDPVFEDLQHVMLQFPSDPMNHRVAPYRQPFWDDFRAEIAPIVQQTAKVYGYRKYATSKVVFSRLRAGGCIPLHTDGHEANRIPHRIHVPLVSTPEMTYRVEGHTYHLATGYAWEVSNRTLHSIDNPTTVDRIHLYFDLYRL